jgi:cobalt/nickel transport system permease protein
MFDTFSDIFARRDNALTRVDPRTKLVVAITVICAVILSDQPYLPVCVGGACMATLIVLRIPIKLICIRLLAPMGIVFVLVVLKTFMTKGTAILTLSILGHEFAATAEGLRIGILLGSRVFGAVNVVLLLSSVSPAHEIFHALRWFRVPQAWVEVALLVYRYIFVLLEQTSDLIVAQRVRLGYSSLSRSLSSVSVLAETVVGRSMDQAMRTYEAMTLRGYKGEYPFAPLPEMRRSDWLVLLTTSAAVVAAYVLVERWIT